MSKIEWLHRPSTGRRGGVQPSFLVQTRVPGERWTTRAYAPTQDAAETEGRRYVRDGEIIRANSIGHYRVISVKWARVTYRRHVLWAGETSRDPKKQEADRG